MNSEWVLEQKKIWVHLVHSDVKSGMWQIDIGALCSGQWESSETIAAVSRLHFQLIAEWRLQLLAFWALLRSCSIVIWDSSNCFYEWLDVSHVVPFNLMDMVPFTLIFRCGAFKACCSICRQVQVILNLVIAPTLAPATLIPFILHQHLHGPNHFPLDLPFALVL